MAQESKLATIKEDPNALWDHAESLEDTQLWQDRQNELDFMRDLFFTKLPLNQEKAQEVEEYFNRVQEAIYTKDPNFKYEDFPDDYSTVDIDGAVQRPPTQYKYFSQDLFKQQGSKSQGELNSTATSFAHDYRGEQDLEIAPSIVEVEPYVSDVPQLTSDNACLEECSDSQESGQWSDDSANTRW